MIQVINIEFNYDCNLPYDLIIENILMDLNSINLEDDLIKNIERKLTKELISDNYDDTVSYIRNWVNFYFYPHLSRGGINVNYLLKPNG
jgi:hypothetical protein